MIGLLSFALLAVASAEIFTIPPNGVYYIGYRNPFDNYYEVKMDVTIKTLNHIRFDVVFALVSCYNSVEYIEANADNSASDTNNLYYEAKNTYTLAKGQSYCYLVHNNNLFDIGEFDYDTYTTGHIVYPEVPPSHAKWKIPLLICGIIGAGLVIAITVYCIVRARHKKQESNDYVPMNDKLEVLIPSGNA